VGRPLAVREGQPLVRPWRNRDRHGLLMAHGRTGGRPL